MKKLQLIKPAVDIRLYDFRHTFATKLAEASMPESALTAIMGHESISTTLQYYIGLTDKMKEQAKSILEKIRQKIFRYIGVKIGVKGVVLDGF